MNAGRVEDGGKQCAVSSGGTSARLILLIATAVVVVTTAVRLVADYVPEKHCLIQQIARQLWQYATPWRVIRHLSS